MSLCYSIVCLFALRSTVYFSSQLPSLWDQLEALWRQERNNAGETVDICDARNPAEITSKTEEGSEISGGADGSGVKENVGRERKEEKEGVNKAEETKEDLYDSGLEISGQEGSANFADVTDDPKKKKAEGKSGEAKQGDDGSWRVLIVWSDPEMHRELRR